MSVEARRPSPSVWFVRLLLWILLPASIAANLYSYRLLRPLPDRADIWWPDVDYHVSLDGRRLAGASVYRHILMDHDCIVRIHDRPEPVGYVASKGRLGMSGAMWPAGAGEIIVQGDYQYLPDGIPAFDPAKQDPRYAEGPGWFEFTPIDGEYRGHRIRVEWDDKRRFP